MYDSLLPPKKNFKSFSYPPLSLTRTEFALCIVLKYILWCNEALLPPLTTWPILFNGQLGRPTHQLMNHTKQPGARSSLPDTLRSMQVNKGAKIVMCNKRTWGQDATGERRILEYEEQNLHSVTSR
ncbi:hypothetical protein LENED_006260 [Lentinula edodes]|uniref:Uncharacterized protein n=1 Tax=Lentinula edodes TaxID=5353 RepID=A0A1Q3EB58_LENED|nr:hypothetical protein LENED_006260 [Lentinula edodes]